MSLSLVLVCRLSHVDLAWLAIAWVPGSCSKTDRAIVLDFGGEVGRSASCKLRQCSSPTAAITFGPLSECRHQRLR